MSTLYHLTADLLALEALVEEALETGDESGAVAIDAWMAELEGGLTTRLDSYARWRAYRHGLGDARAAEAKRLTESARRDAAAVERADAAVHALMTRMDLRKVTTTIATFSLAKLPPVVVVTGAVADLPDDCIRHRDDEADKVAIKAHLVAGRLVAGCSIDTDRGYALRVR